MRFKLFLLLLVFPLLAGHLTAQQVQEFTGRMTDPTGLVVPHAAVIAQRG